MVIESPEGLGLESKRLYEDETCQNEDKETML